MTYAHTNDKYLYKNMSKNYILGTIKIKKNKSCNKSKQYFINI